jgi:hypothetical protein
MRQLERVQRTPRAAGVAPSSDRGAPPSTEPTRPAHGTLLRAGLAVLSISALAVGAWALLAPRSFYASFPGGDLAWVSLLPPYNEHLTTDYGGLTLAVGVVLGWGAATLQPGVVHAGLVATLVAAMPHFVFHATHLDGFTVGEAVSQTVSLGLQAALPAGLLWLSWARPFTPSTKGR